MYVCVGTSRAYCITIMMVENSRESFEKHGKKRRKIRRKWYFSPGRKERLKADNLRLQDILKNENTVKENLLLENASLKK